MAAFSSLYGELLSKELGSEDTTQLFTTVRRKREINNAARWFVTQTECLIRTEIITLTDEDGEYDLEAEISDSDFGKVAKRGVTVKIVPASGSTRWLTGPDLPRRTVEWLDDYNPGWRTATASTPTGWYEYREGGTHMIGLTPAPNIPVGDTWTLHVPYVVKVADMTNDNDVPFTIGGNVLSELEPWHDALVYYAASELEKLRKNTEQVVFLKQMAEARVLDWLDKERPVGGKSVTLTRSYRRESRRAMYSDYSNRWDDPWK